MSTDTPTTPAEPLDDATLAEIEARAEAATAGPWHSEHADPNPLHGCVTIGYYGWVCAGANVPEYDQDSDQGHADAEFIAHARADIPTLLAEVRRAREGEAAARSETMQVAGELAEERTLHQGTMAERERLRGERDELRHQAASFEAMHATARGEADRLRAEVESQDYWYRQLRDVMRERNEAHARVAELEEARDGARAIASQVIAEQHQELAERFRAAWHEAGGRPVALVPEPTTWQLPPEPGPEITQVGDRDNGQWCRLDQPLATGEGWVPADTLLDEVHITEAAIHWDQLVYEYGPLSATPPAETEGGGQP